MDWIPVCSSIPAITSSHIFSNSSSKSRASTIETGHEWDVARAVVMKKNKDTCGSSLCKKANSSEHMVIVRWKSNLTKIPEF
jgi:hypothetical protein